MKLFLNQQLIQLRENGEENERSRMFDGKITDHKPVVKLFSCGVTLLISELDEYGHLFGLADMGVGCPEMGTICTIDEISKVKVGGIFPLERDRSFVADKTLTQYWEEARKHGMIKA